MSAWHLGVTVESCPTGQVQGPLNIGGASTSGLIVGAMIHYEAPQTSAWSMWATTGTHGHRQCHALHRLWQESGQRIVLVRSDWKLREEGVAQGPGRVSEALHML